LSDLTTCTVQMQSCWSTFKYFIILIVSTYYILCISWIIKCLKTSRITFLALHCLNIWPLKVQFIAPVEHRNGGLVHYVKQIILKSFRRFGGPTCRLGHDGKKIISTSEIKWSPLKYTLSWATWFEKNTSR
jgi:hypothetical protein